MACFERKIPRKLTTRPIRRANLLVRDVHEEKWTRGNCQGEGSDQSDLRPDGDPAKPAFSAKAPVLGRPPDLETGLNTDSPNGNGRFFAGRAALEGVRDHFLPRDVH